MYTPALSNSLNRTECLRALGLDESASPAEARHAFRMLVLKLHPDRNGGSPGSSQAFMQVVEAYKQLKSIDEFQAARPRAIPPQEIQYKRPPIVVPRRDGLWSLTRTAVFAGVFWGVLACFILWDSSFAEWRRHHIDLPTRGPLPVPPDAAVGIACVAMVKSLLLGVIVGLIIYGSGRFCNYVARGNDQRATRSNARHRMHR